MDRKMFQLNEKEKTLIVNKLYGQSSMQWIKKKFIDNDCYKVEGLKNVGVVTSRSPQKLEIEFENGELFLYKPQGKRYLGYLPSSNAGIAGNGCDHFYEDTYIYSCEKLLVPKDITEAFRLMYICNYYDPKVYNFLYSPDYYKNYTQLVKYEKQDLKDAKKSFQRLKDYFNEGEICQNNLKVIKCILSSINGGEPVQYSLSSSKKLLFVLEECRHLCEILSSYIESDSKLLDINAFFGSLLEEGKDDKDEVNKSILRQVFEIFDVTPEWLEFHNEVERDFIYNDKVRRLTMY